MTASLITALFFTVAMLVTTAYFIMGGLPLLVLKHDTHLDSRFVRGFFNLYYKAAVFTASAAALSYAFAGMPIVSVGAAALALIALYLWRKIIPKMDLLGAQIQVDDMNAIRGFRRTHLSALAFNLLQLVLIVWSLIAFSPR